MVMTRETRIKHYEAEQARKIHKVQGIMVGLYGPDLLSMKPYSEVVATQIVDALFPPRWREK